MKYRDVLLSIFILALVRISSAQTSPAISVFGDQQFCGESPINVVSDVSITDPESSILVAVYLQISEGYAFGLDELTLVGTHPSITTNWNAAEGKLTLQGPASIADFEAAITNVLFSTDQTNFTQDKKISINLGQASYLPATEHYYIYVSSPGISWSQAESEAASMDYFGLQGYLATLTNEEEAQFAGEQSPGVGWIGASDQEVEGTWRWVTGPENGTIFWIGTSGGAAPGGAYSFWNVGEPNNSGNEDYAHITDPSIGNIGSWNDLPNAGDGAGPENPYYPKGYLVEFGGMPGDPELDLSTFVTIETPKVTFESNIACGESLSTLALTSNTPTVLWYESQTSTEVVNSGLTFDVTLTENTTFWVLPLFEGCAGGERIPFSVTYLPNPNVQDVNISQCDDAVLDGLTTFNLENYVQEIADGIIEDRTVNFFMNEALMMPISDASNFSSTTNPQLIYAEVTNTVTGCTSVAEITLQVNTEVIPTVTLEACDTIEPSGQIEWDLSEADDLILDGLPEDAVVFYYESYEDALSEMNALSNTYTNPEPYFSTLYTRIESEGNCFGIGTLNLIVNLNPNIVNQETVLYCLNAFPETIILNSDVIDDDPESYSYSWSTGETTIDIAVNEIGVYTVEVINPDTGCTKTKTIDVMPSNVATIDEIIVEDWSDANSITVLVSGEGTYEYALSDINGPYQEHNTFQNVDPDIYTVYVRDVENDCGVVSKDVSVISYPKYFTPNGDGINDTWQIKGISDQFQSETKVLIFDRYGKLLFTLNTPSEAWDGTFNGKPMPTNDYWFSVTLEDGRSFEQHFTLKR